MQNQSDAKQTCKHGLTIETCAYCSGLISKPSLQASVIDDLRGMPYVVLTWEKINADVRHHNGTGNFQGTSHLSD